MFRYLTHFVFIASCLRTYCISIYEMMEIKKLVLPCFYLRYFYAVKTDFIGRLGYFRKDTGIGILQKFKFWVSFLYNSVSSIQIQGLFRSHLFYLFNYRM